MKYKRLCIILVACLLVFTASIPSYALALKDDGTIDLYEVFSNKKDRMKTEVGSRIFKWSMHLPDDAIVYKSDKVNYFNMYTESYRSSVSLEVIKNEQKYTLEDILYSKQMNNPDSYYWYFSQKEFTFNIEQDAQGEKYIRIVKMDPFYDYYLVDDAAEEFSSYIENRIYIKNDYIYNLEISMEGKYYRENPEMFRKLVSSLILDYDENNPYLKELSDSVSEHRDYENTSYGWRITVNPYWKEEGISNARVQHFTAVYSHEEIYGSDESDNEKEADFNNYQSFREGITVSLVSSALPTETSEDWAQEEIEKLQQNYNDKVYEVLISEKMNLGNMDAYRVKVKYNTVPKNPYIVDTLYVIGNGYKYSVVANIPVKKYNEAKTREAFETMLKSFKLTNQRSKYLGKILDPTSLINWNDSKEIKTKKYNFNANLTKNWHTYDSFYSGGYGYYDDYYYYDTYYYSGMSNQESVSAYQKDNNMNLMMMAGFDTRNFDDIIKNYVQALLETDEVRIGLANIEVSSATVGTVNIYRIITEYDLDAINQFAKADETKSYDYNSISNQYTYAVKIGNDLYTQTVTIPLANTTDHTKNEMQQVWENTQIVGVNYNQRITNWNKHNNSKFQDTQQDFLLEDFSSFEELAKLIY
ncbi:hypothetical protein SAMN05446037_1004141 [Anaerovirgula multivorans]|uniref:Peptidase propeptide and YPEB domain-containing protein n=1 Tax=Anaerovirgula multivorans TaxID=312168 RepID=A0A239BTV8_9FIRM|nr:hypothetical protein [Anaerovirgula multivorans]SNS11457.1 hypothetical protein SAMN05446037_1004141 [Anaerovirgula multivorans]